MDKDEIWQQTLALMLQDVGDDDLKSVLLNLLTPLGIFGDQFILLAQNSQVESLVKSKYLPEMAEKLAMVSGTGLNIGIGTSEPQQQPRQAEPAPAPSADPEPAPAQGVAATLSPEGPAREDDRPEWMDTYVSPADLPGAGHGGPEGAGARTSSTKSGVEALFSKCTFETFVVGPSNKFARNAALSVAEKPGIAYNPLFIYGGSGLGKTHLLVAVANYVLEAWPTMATRYVSANRFLNDFVEATKLNQWSSFYKKYHQVDILLVDDVQYLEGKTESINQLFNIFNEMTNQNKQIVLAADRNPRDIDMDDRYRSRFMSGLLADVRPPDYETRLAIMQNYLSRVYQETPSNGSVPGDVLEWLASEATSNIREMEGAITRLVGNMDLLGKSTITVEEAKEVLRDFFPSTESKQIDVASIQSEVEHYFKITHEEMVGPKRSKGITMPRHIAIYLSRYLTDEPLESIGKKFGGRDHTTVMYSVQKIEREEKNNQVLFDQIQQLTTRIRERA